MRQRWICLDVGETLVDETRVWSLWADRLDVPRLTFMAAFGSVVAGGAEHSDVFEVVDRPDWRAHMPAVLDEYGAFRRDDLYPDALPALADLRRLGYRLAVLANQPARRTPELRALGIDPEVMAMSEELGLRKPEPAFFQRALEMMGQPPPSEVAYVGDRPDNDVAPAAAAGMRAVWLRRGPWGVIWPEAPQATLVVRSLAELVDRIEEAWA
ncbi:MAG TPA: HAD family hydrolase [Candidatus Limnocylindrales bacterium]|nr:HAD family hydrolase [Candidatus Limnocylindrales bacterium]